MKIIHSKSSIIVVLAISLILLTSSIVVSSPNTYNDGGDIIKTLEAETKLKLLPTVKKTESKKNIHSENQVELLAKIIQAESLGENYEGKVAVGAVVVNRSKNRRLTISQVIYAKNQFDGVGSKLFNKSIDEECRSAAIDALRGVDPTNGCEYFINPKHCNPSWTKKLVYVKMIGNHKFYKK